MSLIYFKVILIMLKAAYFTPHIVNTLPMIKVDICYFCSTKK